MVAFLALLIPVLPALIGWILIGGASAFAIISTAKIIAITLGILVGLFALRFVLSGGRR